MGDGSSTAAMVCSSSPEQQLKGPTGLTAPTLKGIPWSNEEHAAFLRGLESLGKGNWRGISRSYVPSRTPTQVASHAQKYFLRANSGGSKRKSRFCGVTSSYPASLPAKTPRTSPPAADSNAPQPGPSDALPPAPGQQQLQTQQHASLHLPVKSQGLPRQHAPHVQPQVKPPSSVRSISSAACAPSHTHLPSPDTSGQPSPAAAAIGLPVAPGSSTIISLPCSIMSSSSVPALGGGLMPTPSAQPPVYGVPCCFSLPSQGMMGCMLPGLVSLGMQAMPPQYAMMPPSYVATLLQTHHHHLHDQQQQQQEERQQQQQQVAERPFGPLHTLALASECLTGKEEGKKGELLPKKEVAKQGSSSPSASNASIASSCSNHSSHDVTSVTAALRAGLFRPEPVRGSSAQATSLLATLQPSYTSLSCAFSSAFAATGTSAQQQQQHKLGLGRSSAFQPVAITHMQ